MTVNMMIIVFGE